MLETRGSFKIKKKYFILYSVSDLNILVKHYCKCDVFFAVLLVHIHQNVYFSHTVIGLGWLLTFVLYSTGFIFNY